MNLFYYTSGRTMIDNNYTALEKNKELSLIKKIEEKKIDYLKLSQSFREPYEKFKNINNKL